MRVLIFAYEYEPFNGGVANYLGRLGRGLAKQGTSVLVLTPTAGPSSQAPCLQVLRMKLITKGPLAVMNGAITLARTIAKEKPDVIVAGDVWATGCAALVSRIIPGRYTAILHGTEVWRYGKRGRSLKARLRDMLLGFYWRRCALTIANSEYTRTLFQEAVHLTEPTLVVPGAVEELAVANEEACSVEGKGDGISLLTICRLIPEKGVDVTLQAIEMLRRKGTKVRLRIVGQGPDRPRLEALASKLNIQDSVEFLGSLGNQELHSLWPCVDAFILMSRPGDRVEGFGLVFLEAMAQGKPVIASYAMAIPELVREGDTGILVREFLEPTAVCEAIERLSTTSTKDLALNSLQHAARYRPDNAAHAFLQAIHAMA
jgi:phosphatidylinositol alpha-1,6-mannosyltransferase